MDPSMAPSAGAASGLNVSANNSSATKVVIPNKNVSEVEVDMMIHILHYRPFSHNMV